MQYGYRDRKRKKRTFRALWIQRINAAVREHGLTYGRFINGLAQGRHRGRPQGAGRYRRQGCGSLQGAVRAGRRRSEEGGLTLSSPWTVVPRLDPGIQRPAGPQVDVHLAGVRRLAERWIPGTRPGMTTG